VVHYFTKYGSGECYFSSDLSSDSSSEDEDWSQEGGRKGVADSVRQIYIHSQTQYPVLKLSETL